MAPLASAGKRDERVGLEPKEAKEALLVVVDLAAEGAKDEWSPMARARARKTDQARRRGRARTRARAKTWPKT